MPVFPFMPVRKSGMSRARQGLALQASMEGLTETREVILADQIPDAKRVTGTTKTAMAARMRMDRSPERSSHLSE
jgi:hypothetical protein